jgi:hypothetical protein
MNLLAIDPGNIESAIVLYDTDTGHPVTWLKAENAAIRAYLHKTIAETLAVEMIASYGMPVGREVFETCVWIGRFCETWQGVSRPQQEPRMVYRADVKLHLCNSRKAKDANVRQALIDKFGPGKELAIGKKASQGPLYGLTGDCWAALGVAVTASETEAIERQPA